MCCVRNHGNIYIKTAISVWTTVIKHAARNLWRLGVLGYIAGIAQQSCHTAQATAIGKTKTGDLQDTDITHLYIVKTSKSGIIM